MIKKLIMTLIVGAAILSVGCGVKNTSNNENSSVSNNTEIEEKVEDLKIASGSVAVTQVLDRLDIDLVGVPTTKSKLPERYSGVQDIGQAFSPDFEILASLNPELIIFDKNFKEDLQSKTEQYGMETFFFDTTTYHGFLNSIDELGDKVNRGENADELIEELQEAVDKVMEKAKKQSGEAPRVAIIFGTSESYMLATESSYLGDLVKTIGGQNITTELGEIGAAYANFSMEQLVALNPDYVLRFSHGNIEEANKAFEKEFGENPAWQALDAVQEGRVFDLDSTVFNVSANLKVVEAIEKLGNMLYGE